MRIEYLQMKYYYRNCWFFTYGGCCRNYPVRLGRRPCCSPSASWGGLRAPLTALLWTAFRSCRPFWGLVLGQSTRGVFVSTYPRHTTTKPPTKKNIQWGVLLFFNVITCGMFLRSNRSAVWKISSCGTPYFFMPSWKRWMFSISWKLVPLAWIFLMEPGSSLFIKLQRTTPFLRMSSNSPAGTGSPMQLKIHSSTSFSNSLLRG